MNYTKSKKCDICGIEIANKGKNKYCLDCKQLIDIEYSSMIRKTRSWQKAVQKIREASNE